MDRPPIKLHPLEFLLASAMALGLGWSLSEILGITNQLLLAALFFLSAAAMHSFAWWLHFRYDVGGQLDQQQPPPRFHSPPFGGDDTSYPLDAPPNTPILEAEWSEPDG